MKLVALTFALSILSGTPFERCMARCEVKWRECKAPGLECFEAKRACTKDCAALR